MTEFDEVTARVSQVLHTGTDAMNVPTTGLAAVRRRGATRRRQRRAGLAATCAVALAGGGALTVQQLSATPERSTRPAEMPPTDNEATTTPSVGTISSATPTPGATGQPVNRVEPGFVWNVVVPGSTEAVSSLMWGIATTKQAPYLAWSTAPGPAVDGTFEPRLYQSDDGIHWVPATTVGTFNEPQVSRRGLAAQDGAIFAFGTAAATAAIPQGGAGDVVVDVSTDGGTSWQHQVLPIDLRGLAAMDGVGGVGLGGGIAAANGVVVAVAQPSVWWTPANVDNLVIAADGAYRITSGPDCGGPDCGSTVTTVSSNGTTPATVAGSTPADTAVNGTEPADTAPTAIDDTIPEISGLIPFADVGIDPESVVAARTPRAFVSTDGVNFTEATFPALPDDIIANGADMKVFAAGGAFYTTVSATTFDPSVSDPSSSNGYGFTQLAYRSVDGLTWQQLGDGSGLQDLLGVLSDGTLVGRSYAADGRTLITTSADGAEWQAYDLSPLLDPTDGRIAFVEGWVTTVDEEGITIVGGVSNDPIAEAGGRTLEHDGVRLEVRSSRDGRIYAFDTATGEAIAQESFRWDETGGFSVPLPGGELVAFAALELQALQNSQDVQLFTRVLLHSDDGVNWSRENLDALTGSTSAGPGFIQQIDGKVLITLVDAEQRSDTMATTLILVGTRK